MEKMIKDQEKKKVHRILTLQKHPVWFKEHTETIQRVKAENEMGNTKGNGIEDKRFSDKSSTTINLWEPLFPLEKPKGNWVMEKGGRMDALPPFLHQKAEESMLNTDSFPPREMRHWEKIMKIESNSEIHLKNNF